MGRRPATEPSRSWPARPLDLGMFGECKRILDVDAKVSDCTLDFGAA
jgi:hypothetical protein